MKTTRRIGLLVPASDVAMENDLWRRLPPHGRLHVARMYLESTTVAGETKMLQEELLPAARRVASVEPELVIFGCTSAAAILGLEGDTRIAEQVSQTAGCPCVTVLQAAFDAIRQVNPSRLLLITPYLQDVTERMVNTFSQAGLRFIGSNCLGLDRDLDIGAVTPEEIHQFVIDSVRTAKGQPDGIFISCTTFQALDAAEGLERELGIPVFTSNRSVVRTIDNFLRQTSSQISS